MKRVMLMSLLALMPLAAEGRVEAMKNLQQPVEGKPAVLSFGGEGGREFMLDGVPFQIRSGEIHPQRVPRQHWRHRIRAAKAHWHISADGEVVDTFGHVNFSKFMEKDRKGLIGKVSLGDKPLTGWRVSTIDLETFHPRRAASARGTEKGAYYRAEVALQNPTEARGITTGFCGTTDAIRVLR